MTKLKDISLDKKNANRGTAKGQKLIVNSIQQNGFGRSGLLDKHNRVIAGNKSTEASAEVFGVDVEPVIVETTGDRPVYVKRVDLDLDDPDPNNPARKLAYLDNVTSYFDFTLDPDVVMADIEAGFDFQGIDVNLDDLGKMLEKATNEMLRATGPANDPREEWQGMPEFEQENIWGAIATLKVHFASEEDVLRFSEIVGQTVTKDTKYIWFPKQEKENLMEYRVTNES